MLDFLLRGSDPALSYSDTRRKEHSLTYQHLLKVAWVCLYVVPRKISLFLHPGRFLEHSAHHLNATLPYRGFNMAGRCINR
jgi:hypothetical protein